MAARMELGRLMTYKSAWMIDQGQRNTYYASIAKVNRGTIILVWSGSNIILLVRPIATPSCTLYNY